MTIDRLILGITLLAGSATAMAQPADLILRGGEIVTLDPARPRVRALAVRDGVIVAAGSDGDMAALAGPRTRVVELAGHAVVPALTDAHAHLFALGQAASEVDLRGCRSADECARLVASAKGDWIRGRGWDQNRFADRKFPTRAALDAAAPGRAV